MVAVSRPPGKLPWQARRRRASVLAEMALRQERVSDRLAGLRARDRLTQEQAAAKVGVNLRQWQRWEAGDSMPYPRNLDTIASRFGISVDEFFNGAETQLDRIEGKLDQALSAQAEIHAALGELLSAAGRRRVKAATGRAAARSRQRRATDQEDPPGRQAGGQAS